MPNVKIKLKKGESIQEAEETLYKALNAQRTGDMHKEDFSDPAMADIVVRMQEEHDKLFKKILREIEEELDKEYGADEW
jgi:hypothetical protein